MNSSYIYIWDVTINREPVDNQYAGVNNQSFKYAGVGVYMNVCLRGTYSL